MYFVFYRFVGANIGKLGMHPFSYLSFRTKREILINMLLYIKKIYILI